MKRGKEDCFHLSVEIVREIHAEAIARFDGSDGVRDQALLESAVNTPQASFSGKSPYGDVPEMGASYLYYLCQNHPFIDGNKRTALGACLVFLRLNGFTTSEDSPEWERLVMDVASGIIHREEAAKRLRLLLNED